MKSRLWFKIGLLVILGLAVHLLLPQIASLEHSWNVLLSLKPWAVGLAFVSQFLSYLGSGYLLQAILDLSHQSVKLFRSTLIVLGAASVGMVVLAYRFISFWLPSLAGFPVTAILSKS